MSEFLYLADETGREIPGSRRAVDYRGDPLGYFRVRTALLHAAGEACILKDSEIERALRSEPYPVYSRK